MKRSGLMIVSNGKPFLETAVEHSLKYVDELVVVEGADKWWRTVIGSIRSTDGTLEYLRNNDRIRLFEVDINTKNEMIAFGTQQCAGELLYCIDVDEFLEGWKIDRYFEMLERHTTIAVPQFWFYKWPDVILSSARPGGVFQYPTRFFRNRVAENLIPSHIPWCGYRCLSTNKHVADEPTVAPVELAGYHYLAIFRWQLERKLAYYVARGDMDNALMVARLEEFDQVSRKDVGTRRIGSYKGALLKLLPNQFAGCFSACR